MKTTRPSFGVLNTALALAGRVSASSILPLLLLLALPAAVQAQFNYTTNNGKITITGYTGPGGSVTIPSTINGLPVSGIDQGAFAGCTSLTSVTIPNGVTSIGYGAFMNCPILTSVTIPSSVASIGDWAFDNCGSLTSVTIPNGVTSIGDLTFVGCGSLTSVTIPNRVATIGNQAFLGCTGLTNVTIPSTVTSIGYQAFSGSTRLTPVTIPNSVASIGDWAFNGCTSLTSVTIPSSVTSIGDWTFNSCTSLTSVTIPSSVTSIGDQAFANCLSLAGVTIPNSVTSIGSYAFGCCPSLANVTIGNSVTNIGNGAFYYCPSLTSVTIPNGVTSIGDWAFAHCLSLTSVYFEGNAPGADSSVFLDDDLATVYYLPGTTGWGATFAGRPAVPCHAQCSVATRASPTVGGRVTGGGTFKAGSSRTVTAAPSAGYVFVNWTENGGAVSGSTRYTFKLLSDRNLVANFIPNPFLAVSGTYNGLFADETSGVSQQSCGCFTISVAAKGAYTGSLQVGGGRYSLSGQFDFTARASETIARRNTSALTVNLQLDLANGTDRVTGSVSDGTWTATLAGDRAIYDGRTKLAPEAGSYTVIIAGAYGSTNEPAGDGYGSLTVGKNGAISFTGTLADGTKVTQSAPVSRYGQWPLYASLYGGQGVLWSWLTFTNASDLGGPVAWAKLPLKTQYYPAGFSLAAEALGARYFPPGKGTNVLGLNSSTDLTLTLEGGGLIQGITNRITLAANSRVTPVSGPKLSLTFTPSTGGFRGSVMNLAASKPVSFGGVLLQGRGFGSGFFLGTSESGEVRLEP